MLSFTKITTLLLLAIATPSLVGAHLSPAQLTIWSEHAKRADAQLAGCDPKQVAERRARSLARRLKFVEEKRAELGFKSKFPRCPPLLIKVYANLRSCRRTVSIA